MIADFKIELITKCRQFLDIKTTLLLASDMNVQGKKAKSKTLMANKGSKEYLEKDKIEISYHNYDFFKHIQTGEILCKDLSYLDLLFSESTKSKHFI